MNNQNEQTFYWRQDSDRVLQTSINEIAFLFGLSETNTLSTSGWGFTCAIQKDVRGGSLVSFSVTGVQNAPLLCESETCENETPNEYKRAARIAALRALHTLLPEAELSPWGILRGIRPGKLATRMLQSGVLPEDAPRSLTARYGISMDRAALLTDIALRQRPLLAVLSEPQTIAVYVSVPFCPSRCLYCSFPSAVRPDQSQIRSFLQAIGHDLAAVVKLLTRFNLRVKTIYIGGGTPTVLDDGEFAALLAMVGTLWSKDTVEFTVEAGRPDTFSPRKLAVMAAHGVTRISLNPQTMQERTLKLIGRSHSVQAIYEQMQAIRQSGINCVNMDLIAGLPGEDKAMFADTLEQVLGMKPENLTVHTLALKRKSPLFALGESVLAPHDTVEEMVSMAATATARAGLHPYYLYRQRYIAGNLENVGYSQAGFESLYNVQMMEEWQTVVGVGPSAVTKLVRAPGRQVEHYFMPKDNAYYAASIERLINAREQLLNALYGA